MVGIALIVVMGVVSDSNSDAQARVTIETDQVQAVRGQVTADLESLGARRITEQTNFESDGDATMTWAVPPATFEQALDALSETGGVLVSREIDLATDSTRSDELGDQLASLQSCLGAVGNDVRSADVTGASESLNDCEGDLADARSALRGARSDVDNISLQVDIASTTGPGTLTVLGVTLLVVGCLVAAAWWFVQRRRGEGPPDYFTVESDGPAYR